MNQIFSIKTRIRKTRSYKQIQYMLLLVQLLSYFYTHTPKHDYDSDEDAIAGLGIINLSTGHVTAREE